MSGVQQCVYSFIGGETVEEPSCSLTKPFLLCPQIPLEKNGSWNWVFLDSVHFDGIKRPTRSPAPLFFLFLRMYVVTVMGNLSLIILIQLNSHLHIPMYFFLFNLSFIDLCYSSVFTPKMLINFTSKKNIISYMGRMTQLYFFCLFFFFFFSFMKSMC